MAGQALQENDITAGNLDQWVHDYEKVISLFRKLVTAFYTNEFSFAKFIQDHLEDVSVPEPVNSTVSGMKKLGFVLIVTLAIVIIISFATA